MPYLFIVGGGPWAKKIELVLTQSSLAFYIQRSEARRFIEGTSPQNLNGSIIWLATQPKLQLSLLEALSKYKAEILIDKPVVFDLSSLRTIKELEARSNSNFRIVQTWRCSQLWDISSSPLSDIRSIQIERTYVDSRDYISPTLDWLPHDFSLLSDLGLKPSDFLLDYCDPGMGKSFSLKAHIPGGIQVEISIFKGEARKSQWMLTHRSGLVRTIDFETRHSTLCDSSGSVIETWYQPKTEHPIENVINGIGKWGVWDFQNQLEYYEWYFRLGGV